MGHAMVDLRRRVFTTSDGVELPITNLYDRFGDDTEDTDEVASFVAGPCPLDAPLSGSCWFGGHLCDFIPVSRH